MSDLFLAGGGRNVSPIWRNAIGATSMPPETIKVAVIVAASEGYPRLTGAITTNALTGFGIKIENILVIDVTPESESGQDNAEIQGIGITPEEQAEINSYRADHTSLTYSDRITASSENDAKRALEALKQADLVIMTGGDQQRLKNLFNAMPGMTQALQNNQKKPVVAGTSAGAMIQASTMITNYQYQNGGIEKSLPAQTAQGLGLLPSKLIVDTHFNEKDRAGRLASLIESMGATGLGIDEDTGAHISGNGFTVIGKGNVYVLTASDTAIPCPDRSVPVDTLPHCAHLSSQRVTAFKLRAGDHYDLTTGKVTILPEPGTRKGLSL